jgi:uncharacterized protein (DUF58 family)
MAVTGRLIDLQTAHGSVRRQDEALSLAQRLPDLIAAAREISASVMHGVHGRRRAGVGETFWQFRPFSSSESAQRIDWRRSARDDRLFVREREWEAAHTIWLWTDLAPSMTFQSSLARQSKADRAIVLGLAAADLLVRGGERVGLLGVTRPLAVRNIVERLAEALVLEDRHSDRDGLPPDEILAARTRSVLISDFLIEPERFAARLSRLAARGARGHCVMVADPAEDAFPFTGHVEFLGVDVPERFRAGRAEAYRDDYLARLRDHRDQMIRIALRHGHTMTLHRTDRPASEALLALRMHVEETAPGGHVS